MSRAIICVVVALIVLGFSFAGGQSAQAQVPMAVTAYYPPTPVVTYLPERRGLFGQRLVYRPAVAYTAPATVMIPVAPAYPAAVAPTTTYYAPPPVAAPITTYYAPAPAAAPTTTYFAPAAPAPVAVPTTTFYAPAVPVIVAPPAVAPVTVYRPVVIPAVVWP